MMDTIVIGIMLGVAYVALVACIAMGLYYWARGRKE